MSTCKTQRLRIKMVSMQNVNLWFMWNMTPGYLLTGTTVKSVSGHMLLKSDTECHTENRVQLVPSTHFSKNPLIFPSAFTDKSLHCRLMPYIGKLFIWRIMLSWQHSSGELCWFTQRPPSVAELLWTVSSAWNTVSALTIKRLLCKLKPIMKIYSMKSLTAGFFAVIENTAA